MSKQVTHDGCCSGKLEQCTFGRFKRMNYFHGMLLTEEDFVDEQNYIREKLKLHNRLHGAGVIWGLQLFKDVIEISPEKKITKIFIEGGLALDCAGNEIVVCEDYLVPLDEKINELRCAGLLKKEGDESTGPKLYVGIRYCECKSQPAEQYTSECPDDKLRPQFSRVREGFKTELFTADELLCCEKHNGSTDCCSHGCSCCCVECAGLQSCSEDEQVVIIGCIENYDASSDYPSHENAKISPYENCPSMNSYLGGPVWADSRWEAQKQNILRSVYGDAKWIDVSALIGRAMDEAKKWLEDNKLKLGTTYKLGSIPNAAEFVGKALEAQHWAAPDSVIDLVTDQKEKCVLFLFVNPPLSGGA